jgi:hypothetical protein
LLKRALLATKVLTGDLTGRYTLEIHHNGAEVCKVAVVVAWANDVELTFRPRLAPHLRRPINLR